MGKCWHSISAFSGLCEEIRKADSLPCLHLLCLMHSLSLEVQHSATCPLLLSQPPTLAKNLCLDKKFTFFGALAWGWMQLVITSAPYMEKGERILFGLSVLLWEIQFINCSDDCTWKPVLLPFVHLIMNNFGSTLSMNLSNDSLLNMFQIYGFFYSCQSIQCYSFSIF